jgi:pyridoxal phosphate enzyme (YggS family)
MVDVIAQRLADVRQRIAEAAKRAGRDPDEITLVTVTKTWPAEVVIDAYRAGVRHFGENRPEELAGKRPEVEAVLGKDNGIVWHLIGPCQSRKTTLAADHADRFHALDRLKVARRLSNRLVETGKELPVFLEVNVSGESSKAGFDCGRWEDSEEQQIEIRNTVDSIQQMPGLEPVGLMTMAPWVADEHTIRDVFRRTAGLASWIQEIAPTGRWTSLSMGMTDDFELAIEEGATHVRIGRAILGPRQKA